MYDRENKGRREYDRENNRREYRIERAREGENI